MEWDGRQLGASDAFFLSLPCLGMLCDFELFAEPL